MSARVSILRRLDRLASENFGDCKVLRNGVSELRIDVGQGYRVYFSRLNKMIILLICGGDKSTQAKDIEKAVEYLKDFKHKEDWDDG
ncbi:MAG: type II toxin-antitoxin system RelE/ParE family toxin [Synergistaceae bacterium]|nr:type II toxin-antitoxin system RelE/ParE family toxin [Synergistaceae bacterium]